MKTTLLIQRLFLARGIILASALVLGGPPANSEGTNTVAAKGGCMAESVGQNGTPGGTDSQGHERLLCQNAAPGGPENEFFALARGLQRHPGRWGSGDHMFECVSAHFRP
jgi:hypothetical protein